MGAALAGTAVVQDQERQSDINKDLELKNMFGKR